MVLEHILKHFEVTHFEVYFCVVSMCKYYLKKFIGLREFFSIDNIAITYDRAIETIGIDHIGKYSIYYLSHHGPITP